MVNANRIGLCLDVFKSILAECLGKQGNQDEARLLLEEAGEDPDLVYFSEILRIKAGFVASGEAETLLGSMAELSTSLKERNTVAQDFRDAKQHLLDAIPTAPPERAAALRKEADDIKVETVDFKVEIQPLLAMRSEVTAANARLVAAMASVAATAPKFADPALERKMEKFQGFVRGTGRDGDEGGGEAAQEQASIHGLRPPSRRAGRSRSRRRGARRRASPARGTAAPRPT